MLGAVATMIVGAAELAAWKALPGLLIGRLITGVAVGLAAGTAITYLIELRVRADPNASLILARNIGTAVNVGALGIGPLIAGCLAEWARLPLTLSYLALDRARSGRAGRPGRRPRNRQAGPSAPAGRQARGSSRSVGLLVPAALATLTAFSANGLFAGLSGLFLATTFGRTPPTRWPARRCSWCSPPAWRLSW